MVSQPSMTISKRHHYIPRYYLDWFENQDGALWRLDKESGLITRGNKAHFGYKKHWNRLRNPPLGYQPDWAEKRLAEVDGIASVTLRRILSGDFPAKITALACAISFMQNNQPRVQQELKSTNPDKVAHWTDDFWLIVRVNTALDSVGLYDPIHYWVQVIDESDARSSFLTSSNPLIEFTNKPMKLFPISNRHCLVLSYDAGFEGAKPNFTRCNAARVAEINRLTIKNSWQYVYSSTPDFKE